MEKTKELFDSILKESLDGQYQEIFVPEKAGELMRQIVEIGQEKTTLSKICDATILSALISTMLIGNLLTSLQMPEDLVPSSINFFMDTYPNDLYFIIGCLALASERGMTFDGKEIAELDPEIYSKTKEGDGEISD